MCKKMMIYKDFVTQRRERAARESRERERESSFVCVCVCVCVCQTLSAQRQQLNPLAAVQV